MQYLIQRLHVFIEFFLNTTKNLFLLLYISTLEINETSDSTPPLILRGRKNFETFLSKYFCQRMLEEQIRPPNFCTGSVNYRIWWSFTLTGVSREAVGVLVEGS